RTRLFREHHGDAVANGIGQTVRPANELERIAAARGAQRTLANRTDQKIEQTFIHESSFTPHISVHAACFWIAASTQPRSFSESPAAKATLTGTYQWFGPAMSVHFTASFSVMSTGRSSAKEMSSRFSCA